ncbi:MAG: hypothetical protein IT186_20760 [Acidobacteria bacterium]|nr:hypothetical protein [Acidobacteriota bacterium]MCG3195145.1 hypothetical protein [Thermoanaerobaculia bacterium]MCK6683226.1 hypothetical protein [Thermoanaerobaculia bacterium]
MRRTVFAALLAALVLTFPAAADTKVPAPEKTQKKSVPFIEDDYQKALSEARAKKLPIFIEAWAPW